jgi:hypothetical protein
LDGVDDDEGFGNCFDKAAANAEARVLPFAKPKDVAGTDPKEYTTSAFTAEMADGDEDNETETLSIDPKTKDPTSNS